MVSLASRVANGRIDLTISAKSSALKGDPSSFTLGEPLARFSGSRSACHTLARLNAVKVPALAEAHFNSSILLGTTDKLSHVRP